MEQRIDSLLRKYGREMILHHGVDRGKVRGFLQPDTGKVDRLTELEPGPIGLENSRRWIYIGPLTPAPEQGDELEADGTFYILRAVHTVFGGGNPAYLWALCVEKGGACTWEPTNG